MFLEVSEPQPVNCHVLTPARSPPSRFPRASKWDTRNCITKLEATLKWRREYGIYDTLTLDSIKEHVRTSPPSYTYDYHRSYTRSNFIQIPRWYI